MSFLQLSDWLLHPLCILFGLSWRQGVLESNAPGYFWLCFAVTIGESDALLLCRWFGPLLKNQQHDPALR